MLVFILVQFDILGKIIYVNTHIMLSTEYYYYVYISMCVDFIYFFDWQDNLIFPFFPRPTFSIHFGGGEEDQQ